MWEIVAATVARATVVDWLLLSAAGLVILYVVGTWNYGYFAARGIASSRPNLPFFGDTLAAFLGLKSFPEFLQDVHNRAKGNAVYGLFEGQKPFYLVRDPELLKFITIKGFENFMNHRDVFNGDPDPIFSKNLFSLKDDKWREMRSTLSPAFTTSKIKGMFSLVAECAEQMVEHLRKKHQDNTREFQEKPVTTDMKNLFTRMANDVIATVAFGLKCNSLEEPENEFYNHGKTLTTFSILRIIIFILYTKIPKIAAALGLRVFNPKSISFLDSLVHETIQERQKKNIHRPDMLQLLIQAQSGQLKIEEEDKHETEKIEGSKRKLTNEDISGQAVIFFFAGFETVSTALCFATYALAHNPEIKKRLMEEIDEIMQRTGGKPHYEAVQGMKYLDAVISESLRLYPPVINLDRECKEGATLPPTATSPPISLEKDDSIIVSVIGLHHDPDYWPDPYKFDPDRFNEDNKPSIKPFTFMPFGMGPRICVGQRFALVEVKLALIYLLANFDIQPSKKLKYPMRYEKGFNTSIRGGFWCDLIPKEKEKYNGCDTARSVKEEKLPN